MILIPGHIPELNPNLYIRNKLEYKLVKNSSFELGWQAFNTYQSNNEWTWRVVSERYNTTKIVIALQKTE